MISDVDHGDRVRALESGFTGLEDSLDQHRNDFNTKMVIDKALYDFYEKFF